MKFIPLENAEQLQQIKAAGDYNIIFKHNTTCPISKGVKSKLEQEADTISGVDSFYILDILEHRDVSNAIEQQFEIEHQSPQILLIKDGICTYNEASINISAKATAEAIAD